VLVGLVMLGNGVNLLFLISGGPAGRAPIVGSGRSPISDPLPQALVLTAIVISLGTTAFVLAMAYRSWQLTEHDDVQDDVEDAEIRRLAAAAEASDSYDLSQGTVDADESEVPQEEGQSA
jgi:multicomponent Na+:H+ antiporter subunit C